MPAKSPRAHRARRPLTLLLALGALLTLAPRAHAHAFHPVRDAQDEALRQLLPPAPAAPAPVAVPVDALAQKRLYIANDDHTDYEWSLTDAGYTLALPNMLDDYMDQAEATAADPADRRGRFNCDGTVWVYDYERTRSAAQVQRLWDHVRAGDITVPINTCVQLWGAMPAEAVVRGMYYAGQLERRENVRFPLIVPMENQTLPGGVVSLWAGAGARYSWKGICQCASFINAYDRPREIYRFTGPDGQSVLMKWNSMWDGNQSLGGYAEARDPYHAVAYMDTDPGFLSRWPWPVAAAFGYGWDDAQSYTRLFLDAARDLTNSNRRVIVSNEVDFFQDFETNYGASLPAYGAAFGNEWELFDASLAVVTARMKRGVEKLRTAEAMATLVSLHDPTLMSGLTAARDSMNLACALYYEHSWGPGPGVNEATREAWQRRIERALTSYVDTLQARSLRRLGALVPGGTGVERHVVFNPLSWSRTDAVDLPAATPEPRHVVDVATGTEVPSQTVTVGGVPRLRILASQVPSVGYRVYEVRAGAGASFPAAATVNGATLDNGTYAVTLGGRGQLTSVVDHKDGDRQLVATGASALDLGSGSGTVSVLSSGPVSVTLRVVAGGTPAHEASMTLYAGGVDRVDYDGYVTQNFGNKVQYTSSFNYTSPATRHEEVGMVARAKRLSEGGDYADQNTRTEWLTMNHFVDMGDATRGVTLSASECPYFQLGASTHFTLDGTSNVLRTLVGMQDQGVGSGVTNQGGETRFDAHYALRTRGAYDQASAMRFSLEHQDPLVAWPATGPASSGLAGDTFSLVGIDSPSVLLWAIKPAEEGIASGVIVRAWNLAETPVATTLALTPYSLAGAEVTTHLETDLTPATVANGVLPVSFTRQQMRTWRLYPDTSTDVPPGVGGATLGFALHPNPVRGTDDAQLAFSLASRSHVRLTVHDLRGARVATLFDGALPAGRQTVAWSARGVRPGVYFARLEAAGRIERRRIVVLD
jgi:alpha-mannosidase